ncbi:hypothetical protein [Cesiribacter andamanensis]|uniref:Uncharacterized protein n=1 Tax=Cesiribacter andamanensis AMV16 TaxID=1279009 RepID=M7NPA2_9BACT|nr:hypothetical protein [Cesiribacter andamanensis]EMR03555.1 hypothetical protein ADICEAN_01322 [Cesiribacter andamanensis AMV16]
MKRLLLVLLLLPLCCLQVQGQGNSPKPDLKKLDRYYEQVVKDWGVARHDGGYCKRRPADL